MVTVSIGIAAGLALDGMHEGALLRAADLALYRAKASGRNCTVTANETEAQAMRTAWLPHADELVDYDTDSAA
jgi:predicted signal transduction protein with EAL and GGDEF domain